MSKAIRRGSQDQSGAAAVEFALIMIPLFLILFGIIEFGLAYNRQQAVHAATREGARVASIGGSLDDVGAAIALSIDTLDADPNNAYGTEASSPDASDVLIVVERTDASNAVQTTWSYSYTARGDASIHPCDGDPDSERVRVRASVDPAKQSALGISIPFFGSVAQSFASEAVFVCEPRS